MQEKARIKNRGLIYIFTGNGKGKTTAALGMAVRALGHKMKIGWVSWYKTKDWKIGELKFKGLKMNLIGEGFYRLPTDRATPQMHDKAAAAGLKKAGKLIKQVDVLVLDEINNAVKDKLIDLTQLIDLISKRGKTHLILTGRDANKKLIEMADLVTNCQKIKHPFDKGVKAVRGLDY